MTDKWKDDSKGGRDKLSHDSKDGSFRAERISSKGKDHEHHIVKGSTDGKIKEIYRGDKNKRS